MKFKFLVSLILIFNQLNGQDLYKNNFWKLNNSSDLSQIGQAYPQIQSSEGGWWDVMDSLSVYGQIKYGKSPDINPPFGILILEDSAERTDFLSAAQFSHHGFVISKKAKLIFEKYKLGTHWFFPVKVRHRNRVFEYYLFHTNNSQLELFNFSKSEFGCKPLLKGKSSMERIKVKDIKSFLSQKRYYQKNRKGYWSCNPTSLYFNFGKYDSFDIIADRDINIHFYISDRLKKELIQKNITGIEIKKQYLIK